MKTDLSDVAQIHLRSIIRGKVSMEVYIQEGPAVMAAELVKEKQLPIKTTIMREHATEVVFVR